MFLPISMPVFRDQRVSDNKRERPLFHHASSVEVLYRKPRWRGDGCRGWKRDNEAETMTIAPKDGEPRSFSLRDIGNIAESEYRINIVLINGDHLLLSNIGYKYEDFVRTLVQARNELSLKDLLMEEKLRKQGIKADFAFIDTKAQKHAGGKSEVRLYETAMVIMPERSDLVGSL